MIPVDDIEIPLFGTGRISSRLSTADVRPVYYDREGLLILRNLFFNIPMYFAFSLNYRHPKTKTEHKYSGGYSIRIACSSCGDTAAAGVGATRIAADPGRCGIDLHAIGAAG